MSSLLTAVEWSGVLQKCGIKIVTAAQWGTVFAEVVKKDGFSLGIAETDDFLAQVIHESAGLTLLVENLNYSAERLCAVWPLRFPTLDAAAPYARNPEALANFVYGGRMGNVNPGDGWRFRGRGPIQLTGHDNYAFVGNLIGQDLTSLPELMEQPRFALEACIAWWEDRIPDSMIGDVEKVTRRVNGGLTGLADRQHLAQAARTALA